MRRELLLNFIYDLFTTLTLNSKVVEKIVIKFIGIVC